MTHEEVRKLWTEKLRSGEYQQGKQALATITYDGKTEVVKYCCLGVLCDLAEKAGVLTSSPTRSYGAGLSWGRYLPSRGYRLYQGEENCLPPNVKEWVGIRDSEGGFSDERFLDVKDFPTSLARFNDQGKTFAEIADMIDANPNGLWRAE